MFSYSQTTTELKAQLKKSTGKEKCMVLISLANNYRFNNIDSAEIYINQAIESANGINDNFSKAKAKNTYGLILNSKVKFDDAIRMHTEAKKIFEEINEPLEIVKCMHNIGFALERKGELDASITHFNKTISYAIKTKNYNSFLFNSQYLSQVYLHVNRFNEAITLLLRALHVSDSINEFNNKLDIINGLGNVFLDMSKDAESKRYYLLGLKIAESLKDTVNICSFYNNLGILHEKGNEYKEAEYYYTESLKLKKSYADYSSLIASYSNLGVFYLKIKKYNLSEYYLVKAIELESKINDVMGLAIDNLNYASLLTKKRIFDKALLHLNRALSFSHKSGDNANVLIEIYEGFSNVYAHTNNYIKAYKYLTQSKELKDSVFTAENIKHTAELEARFENNRKELLLDKFKLQQSVDSVKIQQREIENKFITKQKQNQLAFFAIIFFALILFTIIIYRSLAKNKRANKIITKQKAEVEMQKTEVEKQREIAENRRILAEEQKHMIEEKQKEILDSIRYAARIQRSLITSEKYIAKEIKRFGSKKGN